MTIATNAASRTPVPSNGGRSRAPKLSFEFFPPRSDEAEKQLGETIAELAAYAPEFVSVTYGAGGSTRGPTLSTVSRILRETALPAAAHLTCVGATKAEVAAVVEEFRAVGVRHFVALRGDPAGGIGAAYVPSPGGYANAAELVAGLKTIADFEISVSAYPEKHPESRDVAADIDMLKRKVDAGAARALTQFFFDNDHYARYLDRVRAVGIEIPVVPGILPVHNLGQVQRFAGLCGASVPQWLADRLDPLADRPEERTKVAIELAARQVDGLIALGVEEFHFYTMNRSALVSAVLDSTGFERGDAVKRVRAEGAAA
ncbi:methylenetetrahydrofolate reductase [NAD(P)H] [Rhizobium sp. TRM96647]|uniref:methylenetetrahydrofolate reductase [NAD(P)H] n=1 Tax=unclassified Rhizobium TaxID=2613769 RepID=UPI0021E9365C|nr:MULTISPECIES: methylenetetrahydrofolate reductase [NAD(P)H] [unclassified Rhizobium]MCV3736795.1 methylenetetrahydrofolate reductase [NAD(P)H] [Rhizobium sp. TRM96647]MCV3756805.1 methylenetetrahydrofolate reductase [NAD(P)H] [Rhizobium sp. TRM96650]